MANTPDGHTPRRASRPVGSSRASRPAPKKRSPLKTAGLVVASVLVALLVFAGGYLAYLQLNLKSAKLSQRSANPSATSDHLGTADKEPIDVLIMGTDSRDGEVNDWFGDPDEDGGGNSDVMILLRISGNRDRASAITFPRDLIVPTPECTNPKTGEVFPASTASMLNSTLADGGPSCTADAISDLTGVTVDHFLVADFNAVIQLTNTLGGVEVCVTAPIDDPLAHLKLPAGKSNIQGMDALAFLRSRHGVGDGSDLARIKSQQAFMASMIRKLKSEQTLFNPVKVNGIAQAMVKNLTFDEDLASIPALVGMAADIRNITPDKVAFASVPVEPYALDPNRVQMKQPFSNKLFEVLRKDGDITDRAAFEEPAPSQAPIDRTAQYVEVYNGAESATRGAEILQALVQVGYSQVVEQYYQGVTDMTKIYYGEGSVDAANQLAEDLGIPLNNVEQAQITGLQVVIGTDFATGTKMPQIKEALPEGLSGQTAKQNICQEAALQ